MNTTYSASRRLRLVPGHHGSLVDTTASTVDVPSSSRRIALFEKGFRPFFLLAALYASLALAFWSFVLTGRAVSDPYLFAVEWHAHEMIFGFTVAVLAGFLLTAIGNWTSRPTATGPLLSALVGLWVLGRVAMFGASSLPRFVAAAIDLAFLPALIVACAVPLLAAKNRRNYAFIAILGALFCVNVALHASALGFLPRASARTALLVAVDIIAIPLSVVSGRVVPMFSRNTLADPRIEGSPRLELAAALGLALVALLDGLGAPSALLGALSAVVGVVLLARMRRWGSLSSRREPLLWVLHAGSLWLAVALLLRALSSVAPFPSSVHLHAMTAGALGTLTLGMMARVALGHTGRPLVAPAGMAFAFVAVTAAALLRVVGALAAPGALWPLLAAGLLWTSAFALYLVTYFATLVRARADGRPG
jgi:uncharacterized protein involved in response to NO